MNKKGSSTARNTATLVLGNMGARVLTFALAPIITRIFSPEDFGAYQAFLSLGIILADLCHLRYPMAVYLAKEDREVDGVGLLSLLLIAGFTALVLMLTVLFGEPVANWLGLDEHNWLLWLLGPYVLVSGVIVLLQQLATRKQQYKAMAVSQMSLAVTDRGTSITGALLAGASPFFLIAGRIAGIITQIFTLGWSLGPKRLARLFGADARSQVRPMAIRFKQFPTYCPTSLLNQATPQLPVLLLAVYFDPAVVGLYALSLRMLREPLNLFGQALARVFYDQASGHIREGESTADFTRQFLGTTMRLSVLPIMMIALLGPEAFALVFGAQWREAGTFARILAPFYALILFSWPMSALFDLLEKQRARLWFDLAYFGTVALALVLGGLTGDKNLAVGCFSISATANIFLRVLWLGKQGGVPVSTSLGLFLSTLLQAALFSAPTALVLFMASSPLWAFGAAILCSAAYYAAAYRTDKTFAEGVKAILNRK